MGRRDVKQDGENADVAENISRLTEEMRSLTASLRRLPPGMPMLFAWKRNVISGWWTMTSPAAALNGPTRTRHRLELM